MRMKKDHRPIRPQIAILVVPLILWLFWCAIYLYTNYYVPGWQREQASLISTAISRDCALRYVVTPASVQPSNDLTWEKSYPPTGREIACAFDKRADAWRCHECGR
jgi:hypothetical protein